MKSDIEPLTIINFTYHPFRYYQTIMKIHWVCIGSEMSGAKAKKLVVELEYKLKNFRKKWGSISCSLTLLEGFAFWQVHGKRLEGSWASAHFDSSDSARSDNVRRRNFERVGALIAKEIRSWKFRHYKTILTASAETK